MKIESQFLSYASRYDQSDGKVKLKIVHTNEVVKLMGRLTSSLELDEHMCFLALACAWYHDIGRFEQLRRYGTFDDRISTDHADLGCEVLEKEALLRGLPSTEQKMILTAVHNHNKYAVEEGLDKETLLLCKLIRDADKCDIFRVFAFEDMVDTMGETVEEIEEETITDEVIDSVLSHQCVDKKIRKTGLDKWIGFLGFIYDLNFDESFRILQEDGYYRMRFDQAVFKDKKTAGQVKLILEVVEEYMHGRAK